MYWQVGTKGLPCLTLSSPSEVIIAMFRYLFTSQMWVNFLDGRVPCRKWEWVRQSLRHSDCNESHALLLVKCGQVCPKRTSSAVVSGTTDSSMRFTNVHI
mgnify:CR=1 FL=1